MLKRLQVSAGKALTTVGEILYGMTIYDWTRELEKARGKQERLFTLIVFGDMLGVPILPPYYTLRLIPYIVPAVESWRRSMLRERDFTDIINQDIG